MDVQPSADPRVGTTFDDGRVTELFDGGAAELVLSQHPEGDVEVHDRHRGRDQAVEVDGRVLVKPGFFGHGRRRWRATYTPKQVETVPGKDGPVAVPRLSGRKSEPAVDEGADVDPQVGVVGVGSPDRVDGGEAGADGEPVDPPRAPFGVDEDHSPGRFTSEDPAVDG